MGLFSKKKRRHIWGGVPFADDELEPHFMVMGTSGSGKTLTIRMLMKSVLFDERGSFKNRCLIYDPKLDFYPILRGLGIPAHQIRVLHPLDDRCVAWDVARDIVDPVSARQLAATMCAVEEADPNKYFSEAAQDILTAVINCFRKHRSRSDGESTWFLNDLVEAVSSPERLLKVLEKEPEGRDAIQSHLAQSDRTRASILSTLRTKAARYENIGSLWMDRVPFSLAEDWLEGDEPSVLLIPTDEKNREALDAINRALIRRASELVLSRPDNPGKEVWFFLDELRLARKLEGLDELLLKGRSKEVRCVLGFQSIEGLHHVYGRNAADELLSQCGNKAILRLDSPQAMNWASDYFARAEFWQRSYSWSESRAAQGGSTTHGVQKALREKPVILPIEFREFPTADKKVGITGAFTAPRLPPWKGTIKAKLVAKHLREERKADEDAGFRRRTDHRAQERRIWRVEDYRRLDLQPEVDQGDGGADRQIEHISGPSN
ncbi:MAG: type IV secretion system DNA-binding domain-containing protein [Planctomycetota bacterium]